MKSLVGDLLDFAQLSNGKFRKVEEFFNIKKVIEEIIQIQEYKAKTKGVLIETIYKSFEMESEESGANSLLYMVCSDEQRIV